MCDMLLSVYCVSDASLKFTLTSDTLACSDLKFCPTWSSKYLTLQSPRKHINILNISSISRNMISVICMFHHRYYNCFKYFPSAKRELLFLGSLRLCKFIAFSGRLNLIICLLRVKQLWMVSFICLEFTSRRWNAQC